ncbi:acyl-CoA dehydrogenase family protein [Alkalihalobacterium alkalinitrilicum]|uniref:acyl-CoA dehydrogenase family protein n=1 Tax=Alkalihalobacterium alkalinitrilicum TaxID=427920 RepID=UPI001EE3A653|nr:acyl-CoA dehydrogenase family protein [Alkalihalobacterium alkalinitrilicum]
MPKKTPYKCEEEITLFRVSIEAFAKKRNRRRLQQVGRGWASSERAVEKVRKSRISFVDIPEKYGGLGASLHFSASIVDEFSRLGYHSISGNLSVHSNIVAHYLLTLVRKNKRLITYQKWLLENL